MLWLVVIFVITALAQSSHVVSPSAHVGDFHRLDYTGVIDDTHVTAKVPRSMLALGTSRLAAVDFDMRFTYMLGGWEGSAHDASILSDSLTRPDELQIPEGKFYLGDAGYTCRPGILPPFRKTRYHIDECTPRNRLQNAKELFNLTHSSLRATIERAFAALKNRLGEDDFFQEVVTFDKVKIGHGMEAGDNEAGRIRGKSEQAQCGKPEARPPFEKEKNK
ncbi:hypothetical protein QYE76_061639 [Lolium multiflorum]|uniref:DDE Tnp4 domain-containing protein n=1 Tax=Lolium multiflorum TaxID=4521 RepID=A0AAD8W7D5_LOLMU|nr:hypothetical protein QYE76_061639 [Lolium multiflorum]